MAFWLSRIIGDRHSTKVTNPRHLTGNFNKHFSEAILVVLEEAFWAGDHVADGVLKDFITSDSIMIESKGIDAGQARNFTRLMITSNASRVAPATRGERRFLVLDVSPARAKDQDYFGALDRQMREGGAEAMLHDLLGFEFDERVLRDPPRTAGLVDQIVEGLPADERWWFTMLYEGNVPGRPDIAWPDRGALAVSMEDLRESFNEFVPRFKGAQAAASTVGKFVREMVPDLPALTRPKRLDGSRPRHVSLPSLDDLRSGFAERYGVTFDGEAKSAPAITWADCLEARLLFMQMPVTVIDRAGDVTGVPVNDDKPIADVA